MHVPTNEVRSIVLCTFQMVGPNVAKLTPSYEGCHSQGLQVNSDHLGFFNAHLNLTTQALLHAGPT